MDKLTLDAAGYQSHAQLRKYKKKNSGIATSYFDSNANLIERNSQLPSLNLIAIAIFGLLHQSIIFYL